MIDSKDMLIEGGNGLGGGHYVRQGIPFLRAYALAYEIPYYIFIRILKQCSGELSKYWLDVMDEKEIALLSAS